MPQDKDEVSDLLAGQVRELMKLVNESDIAELRIERGDLKLRITKKQDKGMAADFEPEDGAVLVAGEPQSDEAFIVSTMVGRFYRAAPEKPALVDCGMSVSKGQSVCVVESMKILNEISSEFDGQIEEILCEDGQAVEYGQPLFRVRLHNPL